LLEVGASAGLNQHWDAFGYETGSWARPGAPGAPVITTDWSGPPPDLPARFDPTARAVYDMADVVMLVVQLLVPCVRTADRVLHHLASTGYALDRLRLVCNRFGRDAGYLEQADVETTLKRKIDFMVPDDWRTSSGAVNIGAPLQVHAPKSKVRLAYRQIALALASGDLTAADDRKDGEAGKKGLFGFFAGAKA